MLLNNVKSSYFIELLFSQINIKRKLRIINYNHRLQNILNINLINYKIFNGKYIIYESDVKAKEFSIYNDHLIYKGNYLNGKRNGEGIEYDSYDDGHLIYKGEFLNGKRNGKGIECDKKKLIFEGEYLNGKRWNGKGFDGHGNPVYELKNGNGYIKEYDDYYFMLMFEGEYVNGEKNGKGKEYHNDILIFEGEYLNGKKWNGKFYKEDGKIISELRDGKGFIKEYNGHNDSICEAQYLNGELNGTVRKFNDKKQLIFEGEYRDGILNGKVKEYNNEGKIKFEGEYLYGHKRKGKKYFKGILEYEGEYLFDKMWNGKWYDENGNIIHELINGNGYSKEYLELSESVSLKFEGEYLNGKRNGKGKEYDVLGKVKFEGEYINGKRWKGKKYYHSELRFEGEYLNGKRWNGKGFKYNYDTNYKTKIEFEYLNGEKRKI